MSTGIPRKDPLVDEAVEILDEHFKRCKYDLKESWGTLSSVHLQFINDELRKSLISPRYYLENYHVVKTEHQGFRTLHPFWDSQEMIYSEIMALVNAGKPAKVLVDKARQLGSSTLSEGLVFHKTIFTEALNSLIVAQDPDQADYLLSMSVRAYENLPWWMRPATRYHSKGRYMVFGSEMIGQTSLNSEIFVAAANKLTGVSVGKTVRAAHLSELSDWVNAKTLTQHIFPTMNAPDTLAILESTARGRQGFWYDFWRESVSRWGDGSWEWKPIFVEWFRCPDKYSKKIENRNAWTITDDERMFREKVLRETKFYIPDEMLNWKRMKLQEVISIEGDQWSFYQEFPATWQESFQSTGLCAFPKKKLQQIMDTVCCPPRWYGEIYYNHGAATEVKTHLTEVWNDKGMIPGVVVPPAEYNGGRLRVWEMPEAGEMYYLGADPAQGLEGKGDFSCIEILRIGHGGAPDVQVAEWHGWINPTPFGHIIVGLAKWYNQCEVAVELNSVGEKTYIEVFRILEYPNLFRWKHYDKVKNYYTDYMAWVTNHKTRDLIIANFRERIMEGTITLYSYDLLNEMMDFSAEEEGERFEGQSTNDDRVLSSMITCWCAHDSDYGKQAAMQPRTDGIGVRKFYLVDDQGRPVGEFDQRDMAIAAGMTHGETPVFKKGWSVVSRMSRKDFSNCDFSPVHDRPGPRQQMHYVHGIPAEGIRLDNIYDPESTQWEQDWRCI